MDREKMETRNMKKAASPTRKKFQVTTSVGKVMSTFFRDTSGVIQIEYLKRSHTINADHYWASITRMCKAIRCKCFGLLTEHAVFLHDNATFHTARQTQESLRMFKLDVGCPYSPYLAPRVYFLF
ncbi:hypothetical protein TNIN_104901 [Trichonephila inaurata madagascariensis]|uniref:Transposase n=1 Tax=Trichonephila inaurata madagascariensis TaxID=2747483 RepID=A0A8X6YVG2_9ARAC|nr:hypothetical protein TNIN_104901 [Trichonephila inaurata madagascariensis]